MQSDAQAIDDLTATFFDAFTNCSGKTPGIDGLVGMFLPEAVIVKNVGGSPVPYTVEGFIEPRRALLMDGSLSEFREWETSASTQVFGNIAQRFSRYAKTWVQNGQQCSGGGAKSLQFVRTAAGWKIASLIWDDND